MTAVLPNSTSNAKNAFSVFDVRHATCGFLPGPDLETISKMSGLWSQSVMEEEQKRLREYIKNNAFNPERWRNYFGKVKEIQLDGKIWRVLQSPCPFFPNRRVADTHMLFFLPKEVDGKPLTLDRFQKLVSPEFGVNLKKQARSYEGIDIPDILRARDPLDSLNMDIGNPHSYFILMPTSVVPGSKNEPFEEQTQRIPMEYTVPKLHEAVAGIFLEKIRTKKPLFPEDPTTKKPTYISCEGVFPCRMGLIVPTVSGFSPTLSIGGVDVEFPHVKIRSLKTIEGDTFSSPGKTLPDENTGIVPIRRFKAPLSTAKNSPVKGKRSCIIA